MKKNVLLFAPAGYSLAETSRMVEIAKGIVKHPKARAVFDVRFISEGGKFGELATAHGFPLITIEPAISDEKIAHIFAVNDEEKFAPVYSGREMIEKVRTDIRYLKELNPVAVVTGSYLSMPVSCRVLNIPLVWTVQSTWFEEFFASGAGTTDRIRPLWLKRIVDFFVFSFIHFWMWYGFIHPVNKAAAHYGVSKFKPVFSYFTGRITLVCETPDFATAALPPHHYFTGPLTTNEEFALPETVRDLPRDMPIVYFAMGSSGLPWVVADILKSFAGKPYRVVAPVKSLISKLGDVVVPPNVTVTDWLPALEVNRLADVAVIHGGIGTVMTAALAGRPVVGVGMQPEQVANLSCLVRKGMAIRVKKSKHVGNDVQTALTALLHDGKVKANAQQFSDSMRGWNGPETAAQLLYNEFGNGTGADASEHA